MVNFWLLQPGHCFLAFEIWKLRPLLPLPPPLPWRCWVGPDPSKGASSWIVHSKTWQCFNANFGTIDGGFHQTISMISMEATGMDMQHRLSSNQELGMLVWLRFTSKLDDLNLDMSLEPAIPKSFQVIPSRSKIAWTKPFDTSHIVGKCTRHIAGWDEPSQREVKRDSNPRLRRAWTKALWYLRFQFTIGWWLRLFIPPSGKS